MSVERVCVLVNPVAGIGGEPGLKGSDYIDVREVIERGYRIVSYDRARRFLKTLSEVLTRRALFIVPQDPMGCSIVEEFRERLGEVLCRELTTPLVNGMSTREHTVEFIEKYGESCDVIVFVGGDGTAVDILKTLEKIGAIDTPVLGVPSGVKVYSGVFARSPETAAYILSLYIEGRGSVMKRPVVDADENALRRGLLDIRSFGELSTLYIENMIQESKSSATYYADMDYEGVARYLEEILEEGPDYLYIVGPGGSLRKIFEYLSIDKTTYGVDAIYMKRVVGRDLSRRDLEGLVERFEKIRLILTPIPGTRFLIGRGNQQISSSVLRRCGRENIIIVASPSKLGRDYTVYVDSGDPETDRALEGYTRAVIGYREEMVIRIVPAWRVAL